MRLVEDEGTLDGAAVQESCEPRDKDEGREERGARTHEDGPIEEAAEGHDGLKVKTGEDTAPHFAALLRRS